MIIEHEHHKLVHVDKNDPSIIFTVSVGIESLMPCILADAGADAENTLTSFLYKIPIL